MTFPQAHIDKAASPVDFRSRIAVCVVALASGLMPPPANAAAAEALDPAALEAINSLGVAAHRRRSLDEASRHYEELLRHDAPLEPDAVQRRLVLRFAPRLFTVAGEYFPLKDAVAILHPDRPVIGYHLFWEDDLGYPADNEPCDHEIVWIEFDPGSAQVVRVSTYFHGQLLATDTAVAEANAHGGRAWIGVEWGFHGSVPWQALADTSGAALAKLREHWRRAHDADSTSPPHPLAREWPRRFDRPFDSYLEFSTLVEPAEPLRQRGLILVSRWPTAAIDRRCLRYNFAAKPEWPWLVGP